MRILLLEDDADIGCWILHGLSRVGRVVDHVTNGREALIAGASGVHDVIILDRMAPELDGLSALKSLRAAQVMTPVLFQPDPSRGDQGSGLGLALVKAIADRHGVRLKVTNGSDAGPGLCVENLFPNVT